MQMKTLSLYVALALAVVGIAAASCFGVMNARYKVRFTLIEQDANYLKKNIYYRVAPRDIKQKIDNIIMASAKVANPKIAKAKVVEAKPVDAKIVKVK
jgi:hypothetical protein